MKKTKEFEEISKGNITSSGSKNFGDSDFMTVNSQNKREHKPSEKVNIVLVGTKLDIV
tara:strand:- start:73 stop:246 length:174 start_codon:yes stop_codon:yes gene_type:complete